MRMAATGMRRTIPALTSTPIGLGNIRAELGKLNVSTEAMDSTHDAIKNILGIEGTRIESRAGRIMVSRGAEEVMELPVFQKGNILTKGGTSWFHIGQVGKIQATGDPSFQSFQTWFNREITNIADSTGMSNDDKMKALRGQIQGVFTDYTRTAGDSGRAMVEPLFSSGRPKWGQAVASSQAVAFTVEAGSDAGIKIAAMGEAAKKLYMSKSGKDLEAALGVERKVREEGLEEIFRAAGSAPRRGLGGAGFTDLLFSPQGQGLLAPAISPTTGAMTIQLSQAQPSDIVTFANHSTSAKGFAQIRHPRFVTQQSLMTTGQAGDTLAVERANPIVQTRMRYEQELEAQRMTGKKGTFAPQGKVGTFVDPNMNLAWLKDSGGIRQASSHFSSRELSSKGDIYTRKIAIKPGSLELIEGWLDPEVHEQIKHQLENRGKRASRQTLEFGTYSGDHATVDFSIHDSMDHTTQKNPYLKNLNTGSGRNNRVLGYNWSTSTELGLPDDSGKRAVQLDHPKDRIRGIKIRDGEIEFAIQHYEDGKRGNVATSLLVGEEGKRVTAARTMNMASGPVAGGPNKHIIDVLADLDITIEEPGATPGESTGKFVLDKGDLHQSKAGGFYRRQFQTMATRAEALGGDYLKIFAESFGLTVETGNMSPTLVVEPGRDLDYHKGMETFEERFLRARGAEPARGTGWHTGDPTQVKAAKEAFKDLTRVDIQFLDDKTIETLLKEQGVIEGNKIQIAGDTGSWGPGINKTVPLSSDEGKQAFRAYQKRMAVVVFDDTIAERVDRVTSVGIKKDGRSAVELTHSRLGYIRETVHTRAIAGNEQMRKVLMEFDDLIIRQGLIKSNPLVFEELRQMAEPFKARAPGAPGPSVVPEGISMNQYKTEFGGDFDPEIKKWKLAHPGRAVPLHMLESSGLLDLSGEMALRTEGVLVDLGFEIDLAAGRWSGSPDDLMPGSVKSSKIFIPAPANILNVDATKSVFLPAGENLQASYLDLIEDINKFGGAGSATAGQVEGHARIIQEKYNKFSLDYMEEVSGKTGKLAKASLKPTFAKYGALSSLPHLKGDVVGITQEALDEMLDKSGFSDVQKDSIKERIRKKDFKVGYLADPMGSSEHYRAVDLKILSPKDVAVPVAGKRGVASAKDVTYISDSLLSISRRDLDADHATISIMSSIQEHIDAPNSDELWRLEQDAFDHLHDAQRASAMELERVARTRTMDSFEDALARTRAGELTPDVSGINMGPAGGDLNISGSHIDAKAAASIVVARTDPAVMTPIPEIWYQKMGGVTRLVDEVRAGQTQIGGPISSAAKADQVAEVIDSITRRSTSEVDSAQLKGLVEAMFQSEGQASMLHDVVKMARLQKRSGQVEGQAGATDRFLNELEAASNTYKNRSMAAELATDELDKLTTSILDIMAGNEYAPGMDLADVKHPVGIGNATNQGVAREFARTAARQMVAATVIQSETGYVNPSDVVAKVRDNLHGATEGMDPSQSRARKSGGAIPMVEQFIESWDTPTGDPRSLGAQAAEDATFGNQEDARRAQTGVPSHTQPPPVTEPSSRPTMAQQIDDARSTMRGTWDDMVAGVKNKWQTSRGFKYGVMAVAGVAALEMIRSTVSGFQQPTMSTPTAQMPPSPILGDPAAPTFDSRMLPQQNRTRIQRTPGMRANTHISGHADGPIDFGQLANAARGEFMPPSNISGSISDNRSRINMDEQVRRRLHAAY